MKIHGNKGKKRTPEQRKRLSESHIGKTSWNTGLKLGKNPKISEKLKGRHHTKESIDKMKIAWNNRKPENIRKGFKHSEETRRKISTSNLGRKKRPLSVETRRRMSESKKGDKTHLWKGGITSVNQSIRTTIEYRLWRESVFKRDNYTCVWCGDDKGGNLQADHIKPFAHYPELRFAIDNGRTLCKPCHMKTDTWGILANKHKK